MACDVHIGPDMETNFYPGKCSKCSTYVPAKAGHYVQGRVQCAGCYQAPAPRLEISVVQDPVHTSKVNAKPSGFLGPDLFAKFTGAVKSAGGSWDADRKVNMISVARSADLIGALQAAGFQVSVPGEVRRLVEDAIVETESAVELAGTRAAGLDLYPFQTLGVAWLARRERALLADDMGLGKTIQTLVSLPTGAPVLIVCPAIARGVWVRELARWRTDLDRVVSITGKANFRFPAAGEVVIVSYQGVPAQTPDVPPGLVIVADEAHALKSSKSQRTLAFRALAAQAARVWLLTGTPLLNRPAELWALLQAAGLAAQAFGSWAMFTAMFGGRQGRYGIEWDGRRDEASITAALSRVSLRRVKSEVLADLPAKTRTTHEIESTPAIRRVSGALRFEELAADRAALAAAKVPAALEWIEARDGGAGPLVVFSAHVAPATEIAAALGWPLITGATSTDERARLAAEFQAGQHAGIVGMIDAMGAGVTLTRSSEVLFLDREWTPELNRQAEDRVYRIGQDRGVQITYLHAPHAIDHRVAQLCEDKEALIADSAGRATVEAPAQPVADLSALASFLIIDDPIRDCPMTPELKASLDRFVDAIGPLRRTLPGRRGPANETETWAAAGIKQLAADDPDGAAFRNDVGFSKFDGSFGRSLAAALPHLTDAQWSAAVKLCYKYRRQVGAPPSSAA